MANWGRKGYFPAPFAYLADRSLSGDFWTIRASKAEEVQVERLRYLAKAQSAVDSGPTA